MYSHMGRGTYNKHTKREKKKSGTWDRAKIVAQSDLISCDAEGKVPHRKRIHFRTVFSYSSLLLVGSGWCLLTPEVSDGPTLLLSIDVIDVIYTAKKY